MNIHLTEIAYVLDRSGSMDSLWGAAIVAFNQFVKTQLDVPGDARLTLVQFDDAYEVPIKARDIQEVPELTSATYSPRGSTALLDAIGRTIHDMDRRISALPADKQPGKVIIAVFTDGFENSSHEFSNKHINDLIRIYRGKGWEFLFLAANQDAIATASSLSMDGGLSANVSGTQIGLMASGAAISRKVRSMRMRASNRMDEQAKADEQKSLDQIQVEEEQKQYP